MHCSGSGKMAPQNIIMKLGFVGGAEGSCRLYNGPTQRTVLILSPAIHIVTFCHHVKTNDANPPPPPTSYNAPIKLLISDLEEKCRNEETLSWKDNSGEGLDCGTGL